MTSLTEILQLYDRERQAAEEVGFRREKVGAVVRSVGIDEAFGWVAYAETDEETADAEIEEQKRHFSSLGHGFEWKWHAHDRPPDLRRRLLDHGFEAGDEETIVVLELSQAGAWRRLDSLATRTVRKLRDLPELKRAMSEVHGSAWGTENASLVTALALEMEQTPERLSIFIALEGALAVSVGWLRLPPEGFHFASLWGGSTATAYRRRGYYSALVAARVEEARERGARFLTVDALPTSRGILEKLGFRALTTTAPMIWMPGSGL